jgi:autotransporter-associated beta strand protein
MSLNGGGGANATIISTTSSNLQTISLAFLGVTGNAQAFTINSGSGGLLITSTVTGTQGLNFSAASGSNARTTLTGANTYSGTTTVVSGALNIRNATGLGGTANGTTVQSGAALELQSESGITIGAEALSLSGAGISSGGALRNISGTNTYGGLITLSASSTIGSDAGVLTLSGSIRGATQNLTIAGAGDTRITGTIATTTGTLAKSGAGRLTLSAANTYTGLTTISGGTLAYGVANALSTGGITLNGGVLDIASFSDSVGQVTLTSGNIVGTTGTLTSTANFSTTSGTISATLGGTNFGIAQQGSGKTVVTSSNAFTGGSTVAAGGVLNVRNAFALGTTGTATVSSGGALELQNSGTLARRLSLSGTGVSNGGALRNVSGSNGISAGITLAGATRINSDADLLTLSGTVGGTNVSLTFGGAGDTTVSNTISIGTGGIIKDGAGKLTLSGTAGTATGNSSFSAGTVAIGGTNIFTGATGTMAFTNGATLQTTGASIVTIARPISLTSGGAVFDAANVPLYFTGSMTGGGGFSNTSNDIILQQSSGTNNIGPITLNGGRLFVANQVANINGSTISVGSGATLNFFSINSSFTLGNTVTLASGGGISTRSGTLTISSTNVSFPSAGSVVFNSDDAATAPIVVNGTYPTLTGPLAIQVGGVNTTASQVGTVTMNAPISGTFSLSKTEIGTLILAGNNTFTGGLNVNAGVLQLSNTGALNASGANAVSVASGAILRLNGFSPTIAGLTGSGTVDNGNATAAALTIGLTSGTSQFDGIIANGASGTTSLVKSGGGTQILTAANTYSGTTSITGGALNVQNSSALGTSTGTVTVGSGAALQLQGGVTISRPLSLGSTGVNADGGLRSISGSNTYSGPITTTAAVGFGVDSGTLTLSGSLGGSNSFTKYGSGLLVLTGTDNITGAHTISGGTYQIGSTGVLSPGGGVVMNVNNATLDLNGRSATIGANGNPTSSLTGGLITTASGTVSLYSTGTFTTLTTNASANSSTISGNLSLGGTSAVFTVNDGAATDDLVVSAVISNGGLTKNGAGQMKLTGANTYGGATTVSAGTLLLGANTALSGSTAVTVAGGVLDGGGFTNSVGSFAITSGTYTGAGTLTAPTYSLGGGTVSGTLGGGTLNVSANTTLSGSSGAGVVNLTAGTLALGAANVLSSTAAVSGSAGGSMSLGGDLTIGSLSGTAGVSLGSSTLTVGRLNTSTTYSGTMSGAGGLTKVGSGTFTLPAANTYTGTTTISAGALNIQNGSALGGTGAGTIVSAGAALQLQGGITVTGEPLTLSGSGVASTGVLRNISGTNTYAGVISLAGSERVFIFSDAGLLTLNTGTITGAGLSLRTGGTGDMTISSVIATGTGGLTKGGLGALTLSGSNTYTGATIINNGVLVLGASNVLSDLNDLSMVAGGINLNGNTDTVASLTMSTGSIFSSGKLTAATYTLGNAVVAGNLGTGTMIVTGTAATLNAALNATADVTAVNLNTGTNTSTLTLGGANRFTNPQVALTGSAGGAITLGGTETVGSLAGGFATNLGSNTLTTGNNNTSTIYSGTISGAGGLTKVGSGTFTLTGTSTFTGPTSLDAGSLLVNGSLASAFAALADTTLGGTGVIGGVLSGAGLVSPGNSPGILQALAFDPTGGLDAAFEFTAFAPNYAVTGTGALNDVLRLTGATPFAGSNLTAANVIDVYLDLNTVNYQDVFQGGFYAEQFTPEQLLAAVANAEFVGWIRTTGAGTRTFGGVNYDPIGFTPGLTKLNVSTSAGPGSLGAVTVFTAIPEPTAVVLAGVGLLALAGRSRIRRMFAARS